MRVRFATLNTWGLPEPFGIATEARLRRIGARLGELDVDVVAFQEVWTKPYRKILVKAARKAGLPYYHSRAKIGSSGLLTVSRLPFEDTNFESFNVSGHPSAIDNGEFLSGKGIAEVRVRTGKGPITLYNTHLHARYTKQAAHGYQAQRIGQIVQLASRARSCSNPLVVLGDFNFSEIHPEHGILTGLTGLRDSALELGRPEPTVYAANPYRMGRLSPDKRVDLAFYREGEGRAVSVVRAERIFDEFFDLGDHTGTYSNHAGLLVELEIAPDAMAAAAAPDHSALELASQLLSQGREAAERRQLGQRAMAGAGLGFAALVAAGMRDPRVTRRKLLRMGLQGAAFATLAPAVGYSVLSEVFEPGEIQAFERAAAEVSRFRQNAAPLPDDALQLS